MSKKLLLKISLTIIISALIIWAISCAVNPVTGKREFMMITESGEISLGKKTDAQVIETYGLYKNQQLQNYINNIGQKMAGKSHRSHLKWEFKLLDSPVVNAFAVPGGYVYFTRGIIAHLNSEAELAGVMGHEIGHVTARHSAKTYSKAMLAQIGIQVGGMLSETFREYAGLAGFGVGMLFLKFSRDNERQADALGVEYSSKSGYDANQMANFFETLGRLYPQSAQSGLPAWFSTHPNPPDRIKAIKQDAQKWKTNLAQKKFAVNQNSYLSKLNGMIYGEDPRQGYVEGNTFYHPQMTFQFPVPANWKVNNTPNQVQMFTKDQDAVILFSLVKENSPAVAADSFISRSNAVVKKREKIRINGLTSQRITSEITSQEKTIPVLSCFIQKDKNIFVFHAYTSQEKLATYQSAFRNTMDKFKRLTDRSKINVKPAKLVVKKVTRAQTLKQVLKQFGVADNKLEEMAILNGRQLNERLAANTLLKIVQK